MIKSMPTRLLTRVAIFSSFVLFPLVLTSNTSFQPCWADETQVYGSVGAAGSDGISGEKGENSQSMTIFADGSQITLDLTGATGTPGEDGEPGLAAICPEQPTGVEYNLAGAVGGNGGNGGNGGDGGDGGTLTVYTTEREYLQQIYVSTAGGRGGAPGEGGKGGDGCQCLKPFWTIQTCTGKPGSPEYVCTTKEYRCQNGSTGRSGARGNYGRDGNTGSLTLINSDKPLLPDQPAATISMAELKERGFTLSENNWETRTGAAQLFAPGSVIADEYVELVERKENSVILVWNAPQNFNQFAEQLVTLELRESGEIDIDLPEEVWLQTTTVQQNNITELLVFNALLESEIVQLEAEQLSGNGANLELSLVDTAKASDLVTTTFSLKYKTTDASDIEYGRVYDYRTQYEGEIPPELVSYQDNRFVLSLGQLPMEAEALAPGTGVEIDVTVVRTFEGKSTEQTVTVREVIRR